MRPQRVDGIDQRELTRPTPKQERSRQTVEKILVAADRIFAERGSAAATTTDIAAAAEVSVGALYRFFPDKHAIGQALAERYLDAAAGRFQAITAGVASLDDVPESLRAIVAVAAELALEHPGYYRLTNELRPDEAGSVGHSVRTAMIDTFDGLLVALGAAGRPAVRRAAVTLAIETVRHTLAICPTTEPERSIVISELAEMVVIYAERRLTTEARGTGT